jgi:hypothetical protein
MQIERRSRVSAGGIAWVVALLLLCPAWAAATATDYTVNFSLLSGTQNATGSFVYDATIANGFSNFMVTWDGDNFDLTSAANDPYVGTSNGPGACGLPTVASAATSFYILSNPGLCNAYPGYSITWNGFLIQGNPTPGFRFYADSPPGDSDFVDIAVNDNVFGSDAVYGTGGWTITAQTGTPEPTTFVLMGTGLGLVGMLRRRAHR